MLCRGRGSNSRPQAYESCALPTELPRHKAYLTYLSALSKEYKAAQRRLSLVAGLGIAPRPRGYEPLELLLLYPAISIVPTEIDSEKIIS